MATKQRILRADRKTVDCDEFTLSGRSCWITVDNLSVWLRRMEDGRGLVVEVYPLNREAEAGPISGVGVHFEQAKVS